MLSKKKNAIGNGIAIGSIPSDTTINNVTISSNKISSSTVAFSILTAYGSTDSSITNIHYIDNQASGELFALATIGMLSHASK
jgi:hypothetical protein